MLILTPNKRYQFHGRENSPSDGLVVAETWVENVYRIHASDLKDTKVCVDVGANIGAVSVWAASLGAHVLAVEPDPDNLELLKTNLRVNRFPGSYRIVEAAVFDSDGETLLEQGHGHSHISPLGQRQVATKRLETILSDHHIVYADVLKIDVEGAEYRIIADTPMDVLRKFKFISLEFDAAPDDVFGPLVAKLAHHFGIEILGSPDRGGYIYAKRYD